ncbi:hypothetical protein TTRE_0000433901 [Trichuris trichiura]|uniref:Uncharacterized protein n=1 Tax=Trichuris trichiura TaxID=36087 RepID=A0A077ZBT7_TRITR|nr:hypothetical protein TTRE_0000433901 [Trichuris trichiura]
MPRSNGLEKLRYSTGVYYTQRYAKTVSFMQIGSLFPKPTCDPREPCRIGFLGMEFCSCPNGRKCPRAIENALVYRDVEYQASFSFFRGRVTFHECEEGEIAWVKKGLHQIINCLCPEPLILHGEMWNPAEDMSQYKCLKTFPLQKKICSFNDTCMIRNRVYIGHRTVSLVKGICVCPESEVCVESGQMVKNRLVELEQDLFKCRATN